ncbi:hypothetical protein EYF80_031683 [Liparis tanakae]|uniref:Uncharacterized protein n=1 Tax=Liparis tanakae TaxID=230148 RepID=A0A4Z2GZR4_9TELE|nr:hypothetical protein EYF80_031683 [Liparis tanakae]
MVKAGLSHHKRFSSKKTAVHDKSLASEFCVLRMQTTSQLLGAPVMAASGSPSHQLQDKRSWGLAQRGGKPERKKSQT